MLLAGWLSAAGAIRASAIPPRATADSLVVLHTNDVHSHLFPFDRGDADMVGGAAAQATLIARERARSPDALLLDAGDVVQGTPVYNLFRGVPETKAMTAMRYDAVALGNHDLDDGPRSWLHLRSLAGFDVLSANVFAAADSGWARGLREEVTEELRRGARWIGGERVADGAPLRFLAKPYVIRGWRGKKIAILGLMTEDLVHIVRIRVNGGVAVADPIAVARRLVPELRAKADLVIALTHLGVERDKELAARVPGIDLIVGGHSHTRLTRPAYASRGSDPWGGGTPIVQAGSWGDLVGRTVLRLVNGRPAGAETRLLTVRPADGEDPAVAALLRPYGDSVRAAMGAVVYRAARRVPMPGRDDVESPLGNFVADVVRETARADIGIVNTGGIRAPLPRGAVTVGDVVSVVPFDNTIVAVPMHGHEVRRLLDFVARRIGKSGYAQVSGVSFVIRGDRATAIRVGSRMLESDRIYRVATIDFLYEGGAGYVHFRRAGAPEETGIVLHAAAVEYLRKRPGYAFRTEGRVVWEGATQGLRDLRMR
jgi:2',3'-cyclic-nucleotide 2'-phosphodiesterase (5'-nucleotidase family)